MSEQREAPTGEAGAETEAGQATGSLSILPPAAGTGERHTPFQPMPELTTEEYAALRDDVAERGIVVPVVLDQHGRILDGHHRTQVAAELGIECPTTVHHVVDDDAAMDVAVSLNAARRHLSREQRRQLIADELIRRPEDSDRAIARRVGCDHKTVGAVRRGGESPQQQNMMSQAEAEKRTSEIGDHLDAVVENVAALIWMALANKISQAEVVMALTTAQREQERHAPRAVADLFRVAVFTPLIDHVLTPSTVDYFRPQWDHETFKPVTEVERADLLDSIASLGRAS